MGSSEISPIGEGNEAPLSPRCQEISIFVSSPGDVAQERLISARVIKRLDGELGEKARLKPYFWEYEPVVITQDYQAQIPPPSGYDIVICILWSRLGSRLGSSYKLPPDYTRVARSGTEYEFVDAALSSREKGTPDLLVWVNQSRAQTSLDDENLEERRRQWKNLQAFLTEWIRDEKEQVFKGAINSYRTREEFETRLESGLRKVIEEKIGVIQRGSARAVWPGNPYMGLAAFEYEHAAIFFGRTAAVDEVLTHAQNRLREVQTWQEKRALAGAWLDPVVPARDKPPRAFVLIFGASGSGKSSLVRAGVLPMLVEGNVIEGVGLWRRAVMKPSDGAGNLFLALARALVKPEAVPELLADGTTLDSLTLDLKEKPASVAALLKGGLSQAAGVLLTEQKHRLEEAVKRDEAEGRTGDVALLRQKIESLQQPKACLVLVLDQLEELFTGSTAPGEVDDFFTAIDALAGDGRILVLATLRSDFFSQCEKHDVLMRLKSGEGGSLHLKAPERHELARIVRGPAQKAGVRFEEDTRRGWLDEFMVAAAGSDPDSLPMLEFCLQKLYDTGHEDGLLTFAEYKAIGQFHGVISQEADRVFEKELNSVEQEALDPIVRALTTVAEDSGAVKDGAAPADIEGDANPKKKRFRAVRRTVSRADLERIPGAQGFIAAFIEARLFTGSKDAGDQPTVSVTHEALLRQWDKVSDWLKAEENQHFLQVRDRVNQRLRLWEKSKEDKGQGNARRSGGVPPPRQATGDPSFLLQPGTELDQAEDQLARYPNAFSEEERAFIRLSVAERQRRETRSRRIRRTVFLCLSALALTASGAAVYGWQQSQLAIGEGKKATAQRDTAWLQEGKAWMLRASVAEQRGKRYPDTLLYAAQAIGFDGVGRVGDAEEPRRFIPQHLYPDDYQKARDWISSHPAYLPLWSSELRADAPATALALDPSGKWLALGSAAGVRLLDIAAQTEISLPEVTGVTDLDFDPSGKTLAIAGSYRVQSPTVQGTVKNQVRIWDLEKSAWGAEIEGQATSLAWSPGGDWLAGAAPDGSILLWKNGRGKPEVIKDKLPKAAISLTFSPEDAFLAAIEPGAGPRLFFPDHLAAAASWQGLVRSKAEGLAELEKAEFLSRVDLAEAATCVAVDPGGRFLATGTQNGNVVLWDAEKLTAEAQVSPEQRHLDEKANPARVTALAFRPDGKQIASAAEDGTIKLWEIRGKSVAVVATLAGHIGAVTAVTYAPGGRILASAGADGSAKLWDVHGVREASPDLLTYVEQRWYTLEPEAAWVAGKDFANLAPSELAGRWRGAETRNLAKEAEMAAKEKRWRFVDLLQRQGASLPVEVSKALAEAQLKTEAKLGASFTNANNMDLLWCPKGTFTMGSPDSEEGRRDNEDLHKVTFTTGFWLGKTEVTQKEWTAVMGRNPSSRKGDFNPVEMVNWEEATEFCRRLTDRERARGTLPRGMIYALPTEAQWEYACRAGTQTVWSFGDDPADLHRFGNYNDKTGNFTGSDREHDDKQEYTAPVKTYPANPWGFYDMHGNVLEWCRDVYEQNLGSQPVGDPAGPPSGAYRVDRGGSFDFSAANCRSAYRFRNAPVIRYNAVGFRVAAVPDPSSPGSR